MTLRRHAISAASGSARRADPARPNFSLGEKQFAFRPVSGANPEEPLWHRPERRFRPSGRIFHEKSGLVSCTRNNIYFAGSQLAVLRGGGSQARS